MKYSLERTQRRGVEEDITAAQPPDYSSGGGRRHFGCDVVPLASAGPRPRSVIAEWGAGTSRLAGPR
jgi:hypothetical protein